MYGVGQIPGFIGLLRDHAKTMIPKKATKYHRLTEEEKADNRLISGIRVISEHAIAGIKRFRSTTDVYRNRIPNLDDTFMLLSSGLWNYHHQFAKKHSKSTSKRFHRGKQSTNWQQV